MQTNKKLKIAIQVVLVVASLLTIANVFYTFPSLKFTVINKVIILAFFLLLINILVAFLLNKFNNTTWKNVLGGILIVLVGFGIFKGNEFLLNYNNAFAAMNTSGVYRTSLVTDKDSTISSVDDITKKTKIGIQNIKFYENGSLALAKVKELNKTDNIKQYPTISDAYKALEKGEIDLMSVKSLADEDLLKVNAQAVSNMKEVVSFEETEAAKTVSTSKDITTEPFTILVSGIDSRSSDISDVSNSDSNVLVTFDPTTGRVTTLTTPRDSYVQIQCGGYGYDKLTHAAAYGGTSCVKKTLESIYDIKVDYTVRINFVGVIDIIDALGGIDVDVPKNTANVGVEKVCEQNSKGKKDTMCWEEGKVNHFDGESALAFARNRYNQDGGDFYRGRNQQIVIEAILEKAKSINNIDTINNLLTGVSKNMRTNLTKNDIISLYEILVGLNNGISIEKLYIGGGTGMVNAQSVVYPSVDDISYASYRMKVSLKKAYPQFPTTNYSVSAIKPDNSDGSNALQTEKTPFNGTFKKYVESSTK
ncbi:LCP family protein [Mycoplasma sp. P36-A1]|uniref:LCP family protein n=1 Tax=Mycoplasma sp. P36-A1 TaxID=3252900 RepID=UPI003C30B060